MKRFTLADWFFAAALAGASIAATAIWSSASLTIIYSITAISLVLLIIAIAILIFPQKGGRDMGNNNERSEGTAVRVAEGGCVTNLTIEDNISHGYRKFTWLDNGGTVNGASVKRNRSFADSHVPASSEIRTEDRSSDQGQDAGHKPVSGWTSSYGNAPFWRRTKNPGGKGK